MKQLNSLHAWRIAREVSRDAYRLTLRASMKGHFELIDQIRRAAISIPANIAEGYALGTRPQIVRVLRISLGSAAELYTHLALVEDVNLAPKEALDPVVATLVRCIGVLIGLLKRYGAQVPK